MKKLILIFLVATGMPRQNVIAQNVGIGITSPTNKLHVFNGSSGVAAFYNSSLVVESSTDNYLSILAPDNAETSILFGKPASNLAGGIVYNSSLTLNGFQFRTNGNTTGMVLSKDGNLGAGNTDPGKYRTKISHHLFGLDLEDLSTGNDWELAAFSPLSLYFNGSLRGSFNGITGAYTANSDRRLKTNIKPMSHVLDKIARLKPSAFQFKNTTDTKEYNGFIAQDVMKVFPAMVTHNVNQARNLDVYSLDYSGFGVVAIKGIQELQKIVEVQKDKIAELEARLGRLEKMLKAINAK